tara:strand:+ start:421 stop:696 length:276 start_codon:yes stop_codon:yes gene_type:complete
MDNYPPGMDWGAYDDYHDPKLECGHRSGDGCDCWCGHNLHDRQHRVGDCDATNCALYLCKDCGIELSESQSEKAVDEDKKQSCKECLEDDS